MNDWLLSVIEGAFVVDMILTVGLSFIAIYMIKLQKRNNHLEKSFNLLQNEFRAMNSGQLGMGREIRKVAKEMANVESLRHPVQFDEPTSKNFEQAGLLLTRGATIEEVVDAFDISPAEAELLAIMRHSAPAHTYSDIAQSA